jgi:hypothetical protein
LALILLALSPVGLYSGFSENGLALIPVAPVPLALSPENRLALIPLALSQSPRQIYQKVWCKKTKILKRVGEEGEGDL